MDRLRNSGVGLVCCSCVTYDTLFYFMHCSGWAALELSNYEWTCCYIYAGDQDFHHQQFVSMKMRSMRSGRYHRANRYHSRRGTGEVGEKGTSPNR